LTAKDGKPSTDDVRRLIAERLHINEPAPDLDLIDNGVLDSLALVELLFELERTYRIELVLEELDVENFRTPTRIAAFVGRQSANSGGVT
jgi:D-alanine--poly(phosphoribitol) ligase subunit 2